MRVALAVAAGVMTAISTYWIGAVIVLLAVRGIPLGSAGGPPRPGELVAHLTLAFVGALVGGMLAARLSRQSRAAAAGAVGILVGVGAFIAFSKPASTWPSWFPAAFGVMCFVGALVAAFRLRLRP